MSGGRAYCRRKARRGEARDSFEVKDTVTDTGGNGTDLIAVFIDGADAEDTEVKAPGEPRHHFGKGVGGKRVVAVNKEKVVAGGGFNPGVARGAEAAVLLRDEADEAGVTRGIIRGDAGGGIRRAVVYDDNLIVRKGGVYQRVKTGGEIVLHIIHGD